MEIVVIIRVERETQQQPRLPRISWSERRFAEALDASPSTSLRTGPSTSSTTAVSTVLRASPSTALGASR